MFMPAAIMPRNTDSPLDAGPTVATIFVRRSITSRYGPDRATPNVASYATPPVLRQRAAMIAVDPDGLALHSTTGRIALTATIAASAMASLDATVVNVALPHIGDDLHAHVSSLQWVLTGYLLALASLILLAGALGERFGRRRVFVLGTIWFAVASLLCGAAPSIQVLIGARLLQGVGGALLTPGSLAIIQASFRETDRAAAVGAWSGFGGIAGAVGPFVGGALVDGPGWRWAFLINVPVAALVVVCARAAVPETKDTHAGGHLDTRGAAYTVVGLGAGTWALTEAGPRGWTDTTVLAGLGVAHVAIAESGSHLPSSVAPLVPPSLFANRTFTVVNIGTVFLYASIGLSFFLVAYELQVAAGWGALGAGVAMLPATIVMLMLSAQSGALAQRIGPKVQLSVGPILTAIGLLLLTRIGPSPQWATDVLPGALALGVGLVTFVAPLTATVMAAADADHVSTASGVNNAIARAASLAGLALIPVVSGLTAATGASEVTDAFRSALFIAAVVAALAGPLMFFGLRSSTRCARSARHMHCAVDGPPLQPDARRCALELRQG
jgi:EmrB/QacA subfamily drug resistance transporter